MISNKKSKDYTDEEIKAMKYMRYLILEKSISKKGYSNDDIKILKRVNEM